MAVAALLPPGAAPAGAQELELGGTVTGEIRMFPDTPLYRGQLGSWQPSLALEPEVRYRTADRRHRFKLAPFARLDGRDGNRQHFDVREATWQGVFADWEVTAGIGRVFWGVAESRHLVDVVNQTDSLEDLDEEDRLGQPMLAVAWQRPWGRLSGYMLFGFRERAFPGASGRLRPGILMDPDAALFPDGKRSVDMALRYEHYFGPVDIGVHLFHGTGREAAPRPRGDRLVPLYRTISQLGVDLQLTNDAWLWKLEALVREGEGRTFAALVAGFERTFFQLGGSAAELGVLVELLYDGRDATAPVTALQRDVFVGGRLALNDVQDTSLLAGAIVDLQTGSVTARLEFERRLSDVLEVEIESWYFARAAGADPLATFRNDSFVTARIAYRF